MAEPRRTRTEKDERVSGARILVVEARFYEDIADSLLAGALAALERAGAAVERVTVPGALEIAPAIVIATAAANRASAPFDGVVALGCVIRGETTHYDIVSGESSRALMQLSLRDALPIGNGILTVENEEQAWARARADQLDKGGEAARAALSLIALKRRLERTGARHAAE